MANMPSRLAPGWRLGASAFSVALAGLGHPKPSENSAAPEKFKKG